MKITAGKKRAIALGLAGLVVVGMSLLAWGWMPAKGEELRQTRTQLQQRIDRTERETMRLTGIESILDARLPDRIELPAALGRILTRIERSGAERITYHLQAGEIEGVHVVQPSTVSFDSTAHTLGRVFAHIQSARPAVAISQVEMERTDQGAIHTTLKLILVGNI